MRQVFRSGLEGANTELTQGRSDFCSARSEDLRARQICAPAENLRSSKNRKSIQATTKAVRRLRTDLWFLFIAEKERPAGRRVERWRQLVFRGDDKRDAFYKRASYLILSSCRYPNFSGAIRCLKNPDGCAKKISLFPPQAAVNFLAPSRPCRAT